MSWEYYVLYKPETKQELEIRYDDRWGWEYNWKNPGGKDRWAKFDDRQLPFIESHLKKYGYKMPPKYLHSETDYNNALKRIEALMDSKPNSIEGHELLRWVDAIERYEEKYFNESEEEDGVTQPTLKGAEHEA
jgi:hypothetical protein